MKTILLCVCCCILSGCNNTQTVSVQTQTLSYLEVSSYFPKLQTGDLLFIQDYTTLSTLVIPGNYKHVAIYLGNSKQIEKAFKNKPYYESIIKNINSKKDYYIYDASQAGVDVRAIEKLSHLKENSSMQALTVLRLKKNKAQFLDNCFKYQNRPYDYEMKLEKKALYCSELFFYALNDAGFPLTKTTKFMQKEVVTPCDIYHELKNNKNIEIVLDI